MKRRHFLKCALVLGTGACHLDGASPGRPPQPAKVKGTVVLPAPVQAFVKAKEAQARADTQAAGENVSPDVWAYFKAAKEGDWGTVSRLWEVLADRSGQYDSPRGGSLGATPTVRSAAWQEILEVDLAVRAFAYGEPEFAEAFGLGIIQSIPKGAIYFGGTDPGRGLVTAFSKSHADADPFFTLTQNALVDVSYLAYARRMYGGKIFVPTEADSQKTFSEYHSDAQRRLEHDRRAPQEPRQLKPGEDVRMRDGRVQVSGQVAVMAINARLVKLVFDRNPEREFYVQESFPLDWMYPHLRPHGLILKLNREPLAALPEGDLIEDRTFWTRQVRLYLGDWLTYALPSAHPAPRRSSDT